MARGRSDGRQVIFLACWPRENILRCYTHFTAAVLLTSSLFQSRHWSGADPWTWNGKVQLHRDVQVNYLQCFLLAVLWCSASRPATTWQPQVEQHRTRLCLLGSGLTSSWNLYHPQRCARQTPGSVPIHSTFPCYIFQPFPGVCASSRRHTKLCCPSLSDCNVETLFLFLIPPLYDALAKCQQVPAGACSNPPCAKVNGASKASTMA